MEYKKAITILMIVTVIFAGLLFLGLSKVDPRGANTMAFAGITIAMLLFVWGLLGTLLLSHRAWRRKNRPLAMSLRQASIFSILVVLALYMQRFELLTWWNIGIMVAVAVLLELFFIGNEELKHLS